MEEEVVASKKPKRSAKRVSSLRAKGLSEKQAKGVKGGIIVVCSPIQAKLSPTLVEPPDPEFGLKR
jgi:hypothetical protein